MGMIYGRQPDFTRIPFALVIEYVAVPPKQ